nr:hypothetical protein [Burkholderia sp. THE68]
MSVTSHSPEASAAVRFMAASRNADRAFRAFRACCPDKTPVEHADVQSQLELALEELAQAQEFFDASVTDSRASA